MKFQNVPEMEAAVSLMSPAAEGNGDLKFHRGILLLGKRDQMGEEPYAGRLGCFRPWISGLFWRNP
jgi:hypothetical protein